MKKNFMQFISGMVMVVLFVVIISLFGYSQTHYTRTGKIQSVVADELRIIDTTGNIWIFYGEGFRKNDNVKMTMYNNHTDLEITDDIIEKVRKIR